ncbi:MAG: hypothetical protein K2X66_14425, partial [Cyanobacteria bacterium]|nr:hypothetical protein [Cyanobacteriota bacterium]
MIPFSITSSAFSLNKSRQSPRFGDCFVLQNLPERYFKYPNTRLTISNINSSLIRQGRDFYFITNHRFFNAPHSVLSDMTQVTDTFVSSCYADLVDYDNVRHVLKNTFSAFITQIMLGMIRPSMTLPLSSS